MGSKRKRLNELNMENKKEVLDLIEKGGSQQTIAVQFGVMKSTVGNIKKTGAQY
jgi:DNA invertase Pin-like site-specific DNA recombinase